MAIGGDFSNNNGPIQGQWQYLIIETQGPFMAIGKIISRRDNGPMQAFLQHFWQ